MDLYGKKTIFAVKIIIMEEKVLIGHSDMRNFDYWWEKHLPSWIIFRCTRGMAKISLQFRKYDVRQDMMFFISPDLYPAITEPSADFDAFYVLGTNDYMNDVLFGLPSDFFIAICQHPFLQAEHSFMLWFNFIEQVVKGIDSRLIEQVLADQLHTFALLYFKELQRRFGNASIRKTSSAETLCGKFYDLVMTDCRKHRDVSYYAGKLCVSANYLSMVLHSYCDESPKQAISRQVISEMKYMLIHTDSNIAAIARELRFPDSSYMCRYFRKETRMALTDYRKKIKI